jgi:hypothetical protein
MALLRWPVVLPTAWRGASPLKMQETMVARAIVQLLGIISMPLAIDAQVGLLDELLSRLAHSPQSTRRPSGATLAALMRATQWQAHSVRGFLSGQLGKKMGIQVKSTRQEGERVYAIQS